MSELSSALTSEALASAWAHVAGRGVGFDTEPLRRAVLAGRYTPGRVFHRERPKADGSVRRLSIPTLEDRALQTAVLRIATPRMERIFHPRSHGYRPGRSPRGAIADLSRQAGTRAWMEVLQVDVEGLFDHLDHAALIAWASEAWPDPLWRRLIDAWVRGWGTVPGRGVPQGAPLSPLLANIYLDRGFDRPWDRAAAAHRCVAWIRYADDLAFVTDARGGALPTLVAVNKVFERCALRLAPRKVAWCAAGDAAPSFTLLGETLHIGAGGGFSLQPGAAKAPVRGRAGAGRSARPDASPPPSAEPSPASTASSGGVFARLLSGIRGVVGL